MLFRDQFPAGRRSGDGGAGLGLGSVVLSAEHVAQLARRMGEMEEAHADVVMLTQATAALREARDEAARRRAEAEARRRSRRRAGAA